MNAALDIITLILIVAIVIVNWRKGFYKSVMGFASLVIAFIVTNIYYKRLADYIAEKYLYAAMQKDLLTSFGTILADKTQGFDLNKLLTDKPTEFMNILKGFGVTDTQVSATLGSFTPPTGIESGVSQFNEMANHFVAEKIVNPVAYGFSCFIAFALIFAGCMIILKIATVIIDKVFKLPGLNFINKTLGFVLGLAVAAVSCFVFAFAVHFAMPYIQSTDLAGGKTNTEIISDTLIFKQFYDNNPIKYTTIESMLSSASDSIDPATDPGDDDIQPPSTAEVSASGT